MMAKEIKAVGYSFPYLFDETQEAAKAYRAACTPDFYLFDRERRLVYRGQMDDSRPGNNRPVTGADLRAALEGSLARLKLERIDLYQLHAPDPKVPFAESVGCLAELQRAGKIRHLGLPNVSVAQLDQARRLAPILSVPHRYNLADRASGEREFEAFDEHLPDDSRAAGAA